MAIGRSPYLSVGLPAYNEAGQLGQSVARLLPALERLGVPFEVILVDDGSQDATPALVDALAAHDQRLRAVHHAHNRGVGAAVATAMRSARGRFFILIPADLALELDDLSHYLDAAEGADIVAGYTVGSRSDYTAFRNVVSWLNRTLLRLLFGLTLRNPNYIHLYRVSLLRQLDLEFTGSALLFAEIFIRARRRGARVVEVPIRYIPRLGGAATGAGLALILRTGRDMARLWLRNVSGRL